MSEILLSTVCVLGLRHALDIYRYIKSFLTFMPPGVCVCVCVCVCVLYNNYSCVKPSAPPRKTMLPAEGQGQREKQRVEKGGEWKKGEGATM